MPHSRGPSVVSQAPSADKQSEPPRLRKRLQKKFPSLRRLAPINSSASDKLNTAVGLVAHQAGTVGQPSLCLSPDLSDAKWHEYLRTSSTGQDPPDQHRDSFDVPVSPVVPELIPQFSHLSVSNSKPRPSLDSYLSSPTSSLSTRSSMRRRAKTPVYPIGQLDGTFCAREPVTVDRSSVDLIAKQYQALIESQDANLKSPDKPPSRHPFYNRSSLARSRYNSGEVSVDLRPDVFEPPPRSRRRVSAHTPTSTSDDGTLVSFDEEAIYFKPMSVPSEPPSPPPRSRARVQRSAESPASDHNLSLQICTDLLTKELSTAMSERSPEGEDISSLQVWVMIEAYERLRDQVKERDGLQKMEPIFDNWLSALYSLHDKLTNDANSHHSHSEGSGPDEALN